jgi:hypothetical protein
MTDYTDAQAELVAHSGDISRAELIKAFDTIKFFFAIANEVTRWRAGQTQLMWSVSKQNVIFCLKDTATVINPPGHLYRGGG